MRKLIYFAPPGGSAAASPALADPSDRHNHDNNNAHAERSAGAQRAAVVFVRASVQRAGARQRQCRPGRRSQTSPVPTASAQQRAGRPGAGAGVPRRARADAGRPERRRCRRATGTMSAIGRARSRSTTSRCVSPTGPVPNVMRTRDRSQVVRDVPRRGTQPPLVAGNNHRRDRVQLEHQLAHDRPLRLAQLSQSPPIELPPRLLLRSVRLGLSAVRHRLPAVAELLFGQQYWINDPCEYRLPYAPPGTRWVRYWNDALLVDMYTRRSDRRDPEFFW